jgi:hypothetical protein
MLVDDGMVDGAMVGVRRCDIVVVGVARSDVVVVDISVELDDIVGVRRNTVVKTKGVVRIVAVDVVGV